MFTGRSSTNRSWATPSRSRSWIGPQSRRCKLADDQGEQLALLAQIMCGVLARNASAHTVLRTASAADSDLDQLAAADDERRNATHRAFVEMLTSNGPLRDGLSISDAADTMSALANPDTYALLTRRRNWTPARTERWLAESLTLLLLPPR